MLPALHGGAIGAFLEITAIMELAWAQVWERMEGGGPAAARIEAGDFPPLPRTIDFTVDYLRSGLPRDAYARARVNRMGRRYASVHVEAWQDNRARLFAQATGHFLMRRTAMADRHAAAAGLGGHGRPPLRPAPRNARGRACRGHERRVGPRSPTAGC